MLGFVEVLFLSLKSVHEECFRVRSWHLSHCFCHFCLLQVVGQFSSHFLEWRKPLCRVGLSSGACTHDSMKSLKKTEFRILVHAAQLREPCRKVTWNQVSQVKWLLRCQFPVECCGLYNACMHAPRAVQPAKALTTPSYIVLVAAVVFHEQGVRNWKWSMEGRTRSCYSDHHRGGGSVLFLFVGLSQLHVRVCHFPVFLFCVLCLPYLVPFLLQFGLQDGAVGKWSRWRYIMCIGSCTCT